VFEAKYAAALPVDRIIALVGAWDGFQYRDADIRYELTGFVRRKVLRSRIDRGVRVYEVNY
jgi:hypothetical protein